MSRKSHTRVSRPLIAALGLTIAVGASIYVHNVNKKDSFAPVKLAASTGVDPHVLDVQPPPAKSSTSALISQPGAPVAMMALSAPSPQTPPPHPSVASAAPNAASTPAKPSAVVVAPSSAPGTQSPVAVADRPSASLAVPASASLAASPASTTPVADAKAKVAAGDLLGARQILNDALAAGHLASADADAARHSLADISQTVFFSKTRIKDDPFQTAYQIQNGDRLARIADHHAVTWELLCRINGLADARKIRAGQWIKIPTGPFHAVISKSAFRMDVYLGSPGEASSLLVTTFPVGLGKDNSTPTGQWIVQQGNKAHPATYYSPRGEGVIAADDPKNPLGGYWLGLTGVSGAALEKNSYGIHGTIDPDSIGKQASMGCIRLRHDDIAFLYDLLVDGKSKVVVKD